MLRQQRRIQGKAPEKMDHLEYYYGEDENGRADKEKEIGLYCLPWHSELVKDRKEFSGTGTLKYQTIFCLILFFFNGKFVINNFTLD